MSHESSDLPPKRGINQNLLIGIIGAVATIIAAIIPSFINKPEGTPTITAEATKEIPTLTSLPPTEAFTATPEPPTATATTAFGLYDAYLALDEGGEFKTTTFSPDQFIYVFFKINDPADLGQIKAIWYTVDVAGFEPNTEIYRTEETILKSKGTAVGGGFGWKAGKYKVQLFLNSQPSTSLEFEIIQ